MRHPNLFVKAAAIAGSLLMGTAFIIYHTQGLDPALASAYTLNAEDAIAQQGVMQAMFMPKGTDTSEIQRRLLLLDSTQRAFLGLLSGQFPPPKGTSYFDGDYLDSLLTQAWRRSHRALMSSSKSMSPRWAGGDGLRLIDSIRITLFGNTPELHPSIRQNLPDTNRFQPDTLRLERLIYPQESGSVDRITRLVDSFPMSPLGTYDTAGGNTAARIDSSSGKHH